ncbi:hypothetical protein TorRG33x02_352920, partial [Trema orientale]
IPKEDSSKNLKEDVANESEGLAQMGVRRFWFCVGDVVLLFLCFGPKQVAGRGFETPGVRNRYERLCLPWKIPSCKGHCVVQLNVL